MTSYAVLPTALWVVPVAELAGVGRHVLDVATAGVPGWRVIVLCPEGPLAEALKRRGHAVLTGPVGPEAGLRESAREVRRVVSTLRPAIVHSHLAFADLAVSIASMGLPVRVVSTEHGIARDDLVYHGTRWRSRLREMAHAARLRRADALIAVTESTAEAIRDKWHPPAGLPVHVVLNGVDRLDDRQSPQAGVHILSLARFAPEKRLEDLVCAFALLADEEAEARLTLAGAGPLEGQIRSLVADLRLEDRVSMPGFVAAETLLSTGHVLAQLSRWENCSYSLLDAQVHGLGVVATAVGGNPELLPERCLVDASQHAAVAERLRTQGLTPGERPTLRPTWPTIEQMCAQLGEVYKEVTP